MSEEDKKKKSLDAIIGFLKKNSQMAMIASRMRSTSFIDKSKYSRKIKHKNKDYE